MDPLSVVLVLVLAAFVAVAFMFSDHRRRLPAEQTKQGGRARSNSLLELVKNGHRILEWTTEILSASPTSTVTTFMGVVTANPATVEHILKTRFDNYPKGDRFITILEDFLGRGIFNSDGDHWRLQRKTASIEFSTKTIRTFVMDNVRSQLVASLLPLLSSAAASGDPFDLQDALERFAFDNVCKVVFNEELADGREFVSAFVEASELIVARYRKPFLITWKLTRFLGVGSERRLRERIATVHRFAMRVVESRKGAGAGAVGAGAGDDLLSRFIVETDHSAEFLRDIIISFVLAGRDTTSAALSWFFWLVSTRPAVRGRILEEIRRVRARTGTPAGAVLTAEEVREMDYLHAALSETLRLYPPVPLQTRVAGADDVLPDGTAVRRGTTVMYSSYAMGRMESIWGVDCLEFRPERWLEDGGFQPKSAFRFPVFHAGPRMCLGKEMAYIQMKAVAATVMERFEVEVVDKEREREAEFTMILKVKGGLTVRVREKQVQASAAG